MRTLIVCSEGQDIYSKMGDRGKSWIGIGPKNLQFNVFFTFTLSFLYRLHKQDKTCELFSFTGAERQICCLWTEPS